MLPVGADTPKIKRSPRCHCSSCTSSGVPGQRVISRWHKDAQSKGKGAEPDHVSICKSLFAWAGLRGKPGPCTSVHNTEGVCETGERRCWDWTKPVKGCLWGGNPSRTSWQARLCPSWRYHSAVTQGWQQLWPSCMQQSCWEMAIYLFRIKTRKEQLLQPLQFQ